MVRRSTNPVRRKRRTVVCTIFLPLLLAILLLVLDLPFPTVQGVLAAIQERHTFGPREAITRSGPQREGMPPLRYYAIRDGDWLTWYSVEWGGLFWRPGALAAVHLDGEAPSAILVSPTFDGHSQELTMASGGPDVTAVEVDYLSGFSLPLHLKTVRREAPEDQCFSFILEDPYHGLSLHASPSACFRARCYNADGKLFYESPHPARWLEYPILNSHSRVVIP